MNTKKIKNVLQSLVALPLFAVIPITAPMVSVPPIVALSQNTVTNTIAITPQQVQEANQRKEEAANIDAFFASRNSPLAGYGMKFVTEAEKNGIDPYLLPAISIRESSGGLHGCKSVSNSVFGYGSCKIGFKSIDESIEVVSRSLGGNSANPNTAYDPDMSTEQILAKYNTVIPGYTKQVKKIMAMIVSVKATNNNA